MFSITQTEVLFLSLGFVCSSEGDFRMVIGEDKSKVANIVRDNIQHFRTLYSNILRDCPQVVYKPHQGKLEVGNGKATAAESTPLTLEHGSVWVVVRLQGERTEGLSLRNVLSHEI